METVIEKLNDDGIDLNDCRGQAYNNSAVMSGLQTGVQKRILEINSLAQFINCENYSLNLACVHAAEVHPTVLTFFGIMDNFFFFSSLTSRWEVLKSKVKKTVNKHCKTKWSSHYNAVVVIQENFDKIIFCLEHFEGGKFSSETKSDAYFLLHCCLLDPFRGMGAWRKTMVVAAIYICFFLKILVPYFVNRAEGDKTFTRSQD